MLPSAKMKKSALTECNFNVNNNNFGKDFCHNKQPLIDMIYMLIAIGLSPGGSSTVHIYTQTIHRTIQNNQYVEQHNN
jgi:uncharacterized integral membrane protein